MRRPIWCRAYLIALEACDGNVSRAADFASISRRTVYFRRELDAEFASEERRIIEASTVIREQRLTASVTEIFHSA